MIDYHVIVSQEAIVNGLAWGNPISRLNIDNILKKVYFPITNTKIRFLVF